MMAGVDNDIVLGVGEIAFDNKLRGYYQDIAPSLVHIENGVFARLDENGIPFCVEGENKRYYYIVTIIQYAMICYEFIVKDIEVESYTQKFLRCINWLDNKKELFNDSYVFRSFRNNQYNLPDGWISGMYQGQAISLYLRAYLLTGDQKYFDTVGKIFNSFNIDYEEGGFKRIDKEGNIWFEEYPTEKPSYVLNGFIYSMFGLMDYYRISNRQDVKEVWDNCVKTLENNLQRYDVWYWSVYDQGKKQLVSYYYQKNVHIPLMQIMYRLTGKEIFNRYAIKWEKNLNNPFHRFLTKIMYRIQPRLVKIKSKIKK